MIATGELEGQFEGLRQNAEEYISLWCQWKERMKLAREEHAKRKSTDNVRCMSSSLSSLADNLAEGIDKDKCQDCKSDLEYMIVNDGSLEFKFVNCS